MFEIKEKSGETLDTLIHCDSLIASGMSCGVDLIRCFNGGYFQNDYQFSIGVKQ